MARSRLQRTLMSGMASLTLIFSGVAARAEPSATVPENEGPDAGAMTTSADAAVPASPVNKYYAARDVLEKFNQKTNDAEAASFDPDIALRSAGKQLDVLETIELVALAKGVVSVREIQDLEKDVGRKLFFAQNPQGGGAPAPSALVQPLQERHLQAADRGHALVAELNFRNIQKLPLDENILDKGPAFVIEGMAQTIVNEIGLIKDPVLKQQVIQDTVRLDVVRRSGYMSVASEAFISLRNKTLGYDGDKTVNELCSAMPATALLQRVEKLSRVVQEGLKGAGRDLTAFYDSECMDDAYATAAVQERQQRFTSMVDAVVHDINMSVSCRPSTPSPL